MSDLIFCTLHERQDLLKNSVKFLNEEWPRSDGSREHSQNKSCRSSPPMSFLLINSENEIVGHARVCHLPNRPKSLWIESVMIKNTMRGQKLGKKLMNLVENWMLENNFDEAFLSTDDQVEFYKRCGYLECDPIIHSTTSTSVFPAMTKFQNSATIASIPKPSFSSQQSTVCSSTVPPPPPPPPISPAKSSISTTLHQYMHKKL
ncbi:unnamed protein product [Caenorhabditis angaria]|uniref:N-acetyltransferase domain-containing protein n=1 Tax=Caenorhabditis angaria TaxID=860376 RepID=A0A9P1IGQ4_9PELO|nr:unnamed protein product [Caenorhabditis angaria]